MKLHDYGELLRHIPETLQLEDDWRQPCEGVVGDVQSRDGVKHHVLTARVQLKLGVDMKGCVHLSINSLSDLIHLSHHFTCN